MPPRFPALEAVIPPELQAELAKSTRLDLEVVFAEEDKRRPKYQLQLVHNFCQSTLCKFLTSKFSDISTCPKVTKGQLLAGKPHKAAYFGLRISVVCSGEQKAQLLSMVDAGGFLDLGKLGNSSESLQMLVKQWKPAEQPSAQHSFTYRLRFDKLPEGITELSRDGVAKIFSSAGLNVLSVHPVQRSSSQVKAADSLVMVVESSVPLQGRRSLHLSGFPGRRGKVCTYFTVYKYPALPPLAVIHPRVPAAATAAAAPKASAAVPAAAAVPKAAAPAAAAVSKPVAAKSAASKPAAVKSVAARPVRSTTPPANSDMDMPPVQQLRANMRQIATAAAASAAASQPAPMRPASGNVPATVSHAAPANTASSMHAATQQPSSGTSTQPAATSAQPAPGTSPGSFLAPGGSAFKLTFATPSSRTKHALQQQPSASGIVNGDNGAAPAKRRELARAAQPAPLEMDDDAMGAHQ